MWPFPIHRDEVAGEGVNLKVAVREIVEVMDREEFQQVLLFTSTQKDNIHAKGKGNPLIFFFHRQIGDRIKESLFFRVEQGVANPIESQDTLDIAWAVRRSPSFTKEMKGALANER